MWWSNKPAWHGGGQWHDEMAWCDEIKLAWRDEIKSTKSNKLTWCDVICVVWWSVAWRGEIGDERTRHRERERDMCCRQRERKVIK